MKRTCLLAGMGLIGVLAAAPEAVAGDGSLSRSTMQSFADPETATGTSWLIRRDEDITAILHTVVPSWHTMTLWWVIFNTPENCIGEGGCNADDIFTDPEPATTSVMFADGAIAGPGGHLTLTARLPIEDTSNETLFGPGLLFPDTAEVHLVVRSHGPLRLKHLEEQIGSFAGGCDVFLDPPVTPYITGECADIQFSIHLP